MKHFPAYLSIPIIVLLLVVAAVFIMRSKQLSGVAENKATGSSSYQLPQNEGAKPSSGFTGSEPRSADSTGTSDLSSDLPSIEEDIGASDLQELEGDASGL